MKENKKSVQGVLTESYLVYLVSVLLGVLVHSFFKINWTSTGLDYFGLFLMVLGPILISLAQKASRKFKEGRKTHPVEVRDFMNGPYKYIQSPSHMGMFLLSLGFSIVVNSVTIAGAVILAYIITHAIFLPKEQSILKTKYGSAYENYLKKVRFSL
jgi:protein-S-isoprenylcysteine O-methyltransferase Ste14